MIIKVIFFAAVVLFFLTNVQASDQSSDLVEEITEEGFVLINSSPVPLYKERDVCLDIINDASAKITSKKILQKEALEKELPDNIGRLTFNALGKPGTDFIKYDALTWCRVEGEEADEFSENLPDARCMYSNTTKGLQIKNIKAEGGDIIVTYGYVASLLALKNSYEFSVRTSLGSYGALQREIQDLMGRRKQIFSNPNLELGIKVLEQKIRTFEHEEQGPSSRALSLFKEAMDKFDIAKEKLHHFYGDRGDSKRSYKYYTCFAWNVYQFRDLIQKGLEDFIAQLEEGKGPKKLMETLDVYGRNVTLHYDINIEMFSKWVMEEEVSLGMGSLFERFIEG